MTLALSPQPLPPPLLTPPPSPHPFPSPLPPSHATTQALLVEGNGPTFITMEPIRGWGTPLDTPPGYPLDTPRSCQADDSRVRWVAYPGGARSTVPGVVAAALLSPVYSRRRAARSKSAPFPLSL